MPGTAPYRKATSTQALAAGVLAALLAVGGCNATTPTLGGGSNTATGAAAGGTSAGANPQLEHCDTTLGTMAVDEDRDAPWYYRLTTEYKLDSTVPVLRTLIQQSNCFVVVERGAALNNMMRERDLAASGEMRQGSKMGKGQMVAADYTMSPTINFSEKGTGGMGGLQVEDLISDRHPAARRRAFGAEHAERQVLHREIRPRRIRRGDPALPRRVVGGITLGHGRSVCSRIASIMRALIDMTR